MAYISKRKLMFIAVIIISITAIAWFVRNRSAAAMNPGLSRSDIGNPTDTSPGYSTGGLAMKPSEGAQDTIEALQLQSCPEGVFLFDNANLQSMLNEFSKSYHMKVQCKGHLPTNKHYGTFSKCDPLIKTLNFIQAQTHVKFSIKGDTILVQP
jgi:hypothetical protein